MKRKKVIWNLNRICAYNCIFCCVDAYHVTRSNSDIIVKLNNLKKCYKLKETTQNIYNDAFEFLKNKHLELSLKDKLKIIDNIDIPVYIDFSGGDPLIIDENQKIIIAASEKFGKNNISISTTGFGLSNTDINFFENYASKVEFTYDYSGSSEYKNRPNNYNNYNLEKIKKISQTSIKTVAQISLTKENISKDIIHNIFHDLRKANIDSLFLMKIFLVGRGTNLTNIEPTRKEYLDAIKLYLDLQNEYKYPRIEIQSILSYLKREDRILEEKYNISTSLNISNLGLLSLSPWAYDKNGNPQNEYIIGSLIDNRLSDLYSPESYNKLYRILQLKRE